MGDYKILRGTDIADLADAVSANMLNGWKPQGGLCFAQPGLMDVNSGEPHPWAQAMVRAEDETDTSAGP